MKNSGEPGLVFVSEGIVDKISNNGPGGDEPINITGIVDAEKSTIHDINERYTQSQVKRMTDAVISYEVDGSYMEVTWQKGALLIYMLEKAGLDPKKMLS